MLYNTSFAKETFSNPFHKLMRSIHHSRVPDPPLCLLITMEFTLQTVDTGPSDSISPL